MVTVFVPSTPTAFSGYVLVVPRKAVVELPMTVEEAMRLLVSGGVIMPVRAEAARADAGGRWSRRRPRRRASGGRCRDRPGRRCRRLPWRAHIEGRL